MTIVVRILVQRNSRFKDKGVSMQRLNAIKMMMYELDEKVTKINERLTEREYADQLVFESTAELVKTIHIPIFIQI